MVTPFSVISSRYNSKNNNAYHLLIQSNADGLCFCVFDPKRNSYIALKNLLYPMVVNDYNDLSKAVGLLLAEEPLLQEKFKTTYCLYNTRCSTLLPQAWATPEQYKSFLELNQRMNDLDEVHHFPISDINAESVFAIPAPLTAKLFEKLGSVVYIHQSVPLIHNLLHWEKFYKNDTLFFVNMQHDFVDIAFCTQGQLKLYNTFSIHADKDLIYFLMQIIHQHELNKANEKKIRLILSGDIENYVAPLQQFFPGLLQAKITQYHYAPELKEYNDHRFALLCSLPLCVS